MLGKRAIGSASIYSLPSSAGGTTYTQTVNFVLNGVLTLTRSTTHIHNFQLQGVLTVQRAVAATKNFTLQAALTVTRLASITVHYVLYGILSVVASVLRVLGVAFELDGLLSITKQAALQRAFQLQGQFTLSKITAIHVTYGLAVTLTVTGIVIKLITVTFGLACAVSVTFLMAYLRTIVFVLNGTYSISKQANIAKSFQLQGMLTVSKLAARLIVLQIATSLIAVTSKLLNQSVSFVLQGAFSVRTLPQKVVTFVLAPTLSIQKFVRITVRYGLAGGLSIATKFGHLVDIMFELSALLSVRKIIQRVPLVGKIALGIGQILRVKGEGKIQRALGIGNIKTKKP